jgi:hypothetical protein
MRLFYLAYPQLLDREIHHAPRDDSDAAGSSPTPQLGREDEPVGELNPDLSWTHYRLLTKVESEHARGFYEIDSRFACSLDSHLPLSLLNSSYPE